MSRIQIEVSNQILVNTDPQRRCYNGCHFKSEMQWSAWDWIEWSVKPEMVEDRLEYWRDLNDYSVSVGGKPSRYRAVTIKD